jgi:hypothetical protein
MYARLIHVGQVTVAMMGPPREFGKRVPVRAQRDAPTGQSPAGPAPATPVKPKAPGIDPDQMKKTLVAIVLTVVVVGGLFYVLPKMGQCDGRRGALGVDWCHAMKAGIEGAARGVAVGVGTSRGASFSGR